MVVLHHRNISEIIYHNRPGRGRRHNGRELSPTQRRCYTAAGFGVHPEPPFLIQPGQMTPTGREPGEFSYLPPSAQRLLTLNRFDDDAQ